MSLLLSCILLIEPQLVLRRTIVMVARDLGVVDFQDATDVARARALMAAERYDGVVLDLAEGPATLELLKDFLQGKFNTPSSSTVIVLAANGETGDDSRLQALGVAAVLGKPVRISALLGAIADARQLHSASATALV